VLTYFFTYYNYVHLKYLISMHVYMKLQHLMIDSSFAYWAAVWKYRYKYKTIL